jgi:antitoxin ChpS
MLQTLRKAGGSLVMTVPKTFIDQNGLAEGSQVELHLSGRKMTVEAPTHVEGWDEMPAVGLERG